MSRNTDANKKVQITLKLLCTSEQETELIKAKIKKYKEGNTDYKFPINHGFLYQETIYKVK